MHVALNEVLEGKDGFAAFNLYWGTLDHSKLEFSRRDQDLVSIAESQLSKFKRLHANHLVPVEMENRLYSEYKGVKIEGTPDFVGLYKGLPAIVDFKTSAQPYDKFKLECNEQMYMYAYLAQQCLKYEIKQLVYIVLVKYTAGIQVIKTELTQEKLIDMMDNIRELVVELDERTTFPANRNACMIGSRKCDYSNVCYPPISITNAEPSESGS
jgi:hypothetical protein